ncbi:MAG: hypothetical protein Q4F81_04605 [Eubacteriales bacterium]|nr:hypothetical protein [Eubacteriales bacterium]
MSTINGARFTRTVFEIVDGIGFNHITTMFALNGISGNSHKITPSLLYISVLIFDRAGFKFGRVFLTKKFAGIGFPIARKVLARNALVGSTKVEELFGDIVYVAHFVFLVGSHHLIRGFPDPRQCVVTAIDRKSKNQ